MTNVIAVFNAGSSSLKYSIFRQHDLSLLHHGHSDIPPGNDGYTVAVKTALNWLDAHKDGLNLAVAGHRVVHGGNHSAPARLTPDIIKELKTLIPLAPLHQPHNIRIIESLSALYPDLPQIACFDTAFHHTQPEIGRRFALPRCFHDEGIKRYGFHGLSYEYIASQLPAVAGDKAHGRIIVAHLGNGASLCAMQDLKSMASSMGFSTLDGLMMGTRCGTLDAGVPLYMQDHLGLSVDEVTDILYHKSGLLGVSGLSHDMRALEASMAAQAQEACDLFCRMAAQHIGSMIAVLGGLDALVFTGGIGENSARIRRDISAYFTWAGLALDEESNHKNAGSIHRAYSTISAYVIQTNEELVIARACNYCSA